MRGLIVGTLLVAAAALSGCKKTCYVTECELGHYRNLTLTGVQHNPIDGITPPKSADLKPSTILDPERPEKPLSLSEAIAVALEQGTVGVQSPFVDRSGSINDLLTQFNGAGVSLSDSVRVLALAPAITAVNTEASLSKFDVRWFTSMNWNTTDQPVANALQTLQAFGGQNVIVQDNAAFQTSLTKPLATGGLAGITFSTNYQLSNLQQAVNPNYQPNLTFNFEQPLLQGFGVEINQLRDRVPFPILVPFQIDGSPSGFGNGGGREGILITRVRTDQQRAEFDRNLNFMLVNIETSYWNLYGAYWNLYAREQALRQGFATWRLIKAKYEAGSEPVQELAQARRQYEEFRGQRLEALGQVLEAERQLRGFMGLPVEDGTRLVPVDAPTLAPYQPDWSESVNEALAFRPELELVRLELKARQMQAALQKNFLMPDLRFVSQYGLTGIGSQLDGSAPDNAFRSLADNKFHNWQLGLQLYVPLGFREAHANVRQARLALAQTYALLADQELKAKRFLENQYRTLIQNYEQIKVQRARREASAVELRARYLEFLAGLGERQGRRAATVDVLLEAQRFWADALAAEYIAIRNYNNALAGFEFGKGTIQRYDNVVISEGELPGCAHVRAVEHEKRRSKALLLRHREAPISYEECVPNGPCLPKLPAHEAAPLTRVSTVKELMGPVPTLAPPDGAKEGEGLDMNDMTRRVFNAAEKAAQSVPQTAPQTELPPLPAAQDRKVVLPPLPTTEQTEPLGATTPPRGEEEPFVPVPASEPLPLTGAPVEGTIELPADLPLLPDEASSVPAPVVETPLAPLPASEPQEPLPPLPPVEAPASTEVTPLSAAPTPIENLPPVQAIGHEEASQPRLPPLTEVPRQEATAPRALPTRLPEPVAQDPRMDFSAPPPIPQRVLSQPAPWAPRGN